MQTPSLPCKRGTKDRNFLYVKHEFFDVSRAQGIRDVPADARENDILWKMGPLETHHDRLSPASIRRLVGRLEA